MRGRGELLGPKKADTKLPASRPTRHAAAPAATPLPYAGAKGPSSAPDSFAPLAQASDPAVVFVRTVSSQRRGFSRVLAQGSGSGFVFDPAGKILTNYHVVQGAHAIEVEFSDDRTFLGQVVGADPHTDVAVIAIEAKDLPSLPLGDSDEVQVGDWVLAIGNPFGLSHTVSAGIISARGRTGQDVRLEDPSAYYNFLQTDASINLWQLGRSVDRSFRARRGHEHGDQSRGEQHWFRDSGEHAARALPRLLSEGVVRRAAIGVHVDGVDRQLQVEPRSSPIVVVRSSAPCSPMDPPPRQDSSRATSSSSSMASRLQHQKTCAGERASRTLVEAVGLVVLREGKRTPLSVKPAPMSGR